MDGVWCFAHQTHLAYQPQSSLLLHSMCEAALDSHATKSLSSGTSVHKSGSIPPAMLIIADLAVGRQSKLAFCSPHSLSFSCSWPAGTSLQIPLAK